MRGSGALVVLSMLAFAVIPATAEEPVVVMEELVMTTRDGTNVTGRLAYVNGTDPTTLVVMVHGQGNTVEGAWLGHIRETASHGVAVVAVNFRDNMGFPAMQGAEDTIDATHLAKARFPSVTRVLLFGVSMGGCISGIAAAEAPGLYDYWFNVEGVANLYETYAEAKGVGHPAAAGIERDAGGTPQQVPTEYARRSPALRASDLAYLDGVFMVHAVNDGLVPYDQAIEMNAALHAANIPTMFVTVGRENPDHTTHTTGTGQIARLVGINDPNEWNTLGLKAHLAGHSWEGDRDSIVMREAFTALFDVIHGGPSWTGYGTGDTAWNVKVRVNP